MNILSTKIPAVAVCVSMFFSTISCVDNEESGNGLPENIPEQYENYNGFISLSENEIEVFIYINYCHCNNFQIPEFRNCSQTTDRGSRCRLENEIKSISITGTGLFEEVDSFNHYNGFHLRTQFEVNVGEYIYLKINGLYGVLEIGLEIPQDFDVPSFKVSDVGRSSIVDWDPQGSSEVALFSSIYRQTYCRLSDNGISQVEPLFRDEGINLEYRWSFGIVAPTNIELFRAVPSQRE